MSKRILIDGGEEVLNRIQRTKITLEELTVEHDSSSGQYVLAVIGKIRILNLAFKKSVFARVTFNKWASYRDYHGTFTETSPDESSDVFVFGFVRRDKRPINVELSLSCVQDGIEYWDNNDGKNYCFYLAEDPFNELALEQKAVPETATEKEEESLEQREKETISDTSSYSSFEAHSLTPTKLRFYSSLKNAPEQQVIPAQVKDTKHVRAFNALAVETLLTKQESPPPNAQDEQIEAASANTEECEISITVIETTNAATEEDSIVAEEAVEPMKVTKPVEEKTHDEIFDKFQKEQEEMTIGVQITEEPGSDGAVGGGGTQHQSADDTNAVAKNDAKKVKKKKKKTKDKKNRKSSDKKQKSVDQNNGDDRSVSSTKEKIENEEPAKKQKKSFLSRMACCGKAEPN